MDEPIFTRRELELGKYTRWATRWGVTAGTLRTLARVVGELNASAGPLLRLLWEHRGEWRGAERGYLALEALCNMARGERFGVDDWARRMHQGRMSLEYSDLPAAARQALRGASPDATWDFVMTISEGFEAGGKNGAGEQVFAYITAQGKILDLGAGRQRRKALPSAIPAELETTLAEHPLTRWAVDRGFTREELRCLIWVAGEAGGRAGPLVEVLEKRREQVADHRRAMVALQVLVDMVVICEWMSAEELLRRIERGRPRLEWSDLPEDVRAALQRAAPGADWSYRGMSPDGFTLGGTAPGAGSIRAEVPHSGGLTLWTWIPQAQLPAPIVADLNRRAPGFKLQSAQAVGPDLETILAYELRLEVASPSGTAQRLQLRYGADGRGLASEDTSAPG